MQHRFSRVLKQFASFTLIPIGLASAACSGTVDPNDPELGQSLQELAGTSACPAGYEIIQGTSGPDVIDASAHTNSVCILGNGGNDTITGGSAGDWIAGGLGDDIINGGPGNDTLHGEDGNDTIHGNGGGDLIYGETGVDQLFGDDGGDFFFNNSGNDTMFGGTGDDQFNGGPNDDTFHGDDGNDAMFGNDGNDTLEGGNGNDTLNGGNGGDHLWGDFINNATATTGTTVDTLHGNAGDDDLHGGPGNDLLYGDSGNDTLNGDDGDDRINGGTAGTKTISGGNGNDLAKGSGTGSAAGDENNDALAVAGSVNGGNGTDACTGTSCELSEPPTFCTSVAGQCGTGQRCALEVNICIYCQSNSECAAGQECVPTKGCSSTELVCDDGVDNDGDTLIDCLDSDCAQDLACQTGVSGTGNVGAFHNCITNSSGQVKCWGRSICGELGYFPTTVCTGNNCSMTPTVINYAITSPKAVRGGSTHTCALLQDGTVQCWGRNVEGQLGNGTTSTVCATSANAVTGLSGVTELVSGGNFNCALTGGTVMCWGENNFGQLGNGGGGNKSTPVAVQGLGGTVADVSAGIQHACARLTTGLIKCWGRNHVGQLGTGSTSPASSPTAVSVGTVGAVAQISTGAEFTCGRRASGTVFCWGRNNSGQLGMGTTDFLVHPTPTQVTGILDAVGLGSGWYHSCIKRATQGLRCWGRNDVGQLGNGGTTPFSGGGGGVGTPTVLGIFDATQFAMGQRYSCVRRASGSLTCWGGNEFGQQGNGTIANQLSPAAVPGVP